MRHRPATGIESTRALSFLVELELGSSFLFEHDLFRKPVPTFRDHAQAQNKRGEARVTKDEILDLEQRRFKAMCNGDADALGALLHDGLTYAHSSGASDSKRSDTRGVRGEP